MIRRRRISRILDAVAARLAEPVVGRWASVSQEELDLLIAEAAKEDHSA